MKGSRKERKNEIEDQRKRELQAALELVRRTQTAFWDALGDLEGLLGGVDLDGARDFLDIEVEDLLDMAEDGEEN